MPEGVKGAGPEAGGGPAPGRGGGGHAGRAGRAIVVAGEALVDLVPDDAGRLQALPGGGPFNAARAAARLGAEVAFLGRLSTDLLGRRLRAGLTGDGVDVRTAVATEDPTTLALAEVGADGGAAYRFYAAGTSAPGLTDEDVAAALAGVEVGVLCVGTLGLVFEPSAGALERLVAAAGENVLVVVDPNCRPAAIADEPAYRARLARILARADVVKASADDLDWLVPGATPAAAMETLLREGAIGVVTLGGDGALLVPGGDAIPAPQVDVVDTIGAGDAFLGALLAWWQRAGSIDADAVAFACSIAARTCERAGADPPRASVPDRS
jgi:fructokinase